MDIIITLLKIIHVLLCVFVIVGVLFMHQKSEGLSGVMGGSSFSSRSAKGMDEGMRRMITWLAGALVLSSLILGFLGI